MAKSFAEFWRKKVHLEPKHRHPPIDEANKAEQVDHNHGLHFERNQGDAINPNPISFQLPLDKVVLRQRRHSSFLLSKIPEIKVFSEDSDFAHSLPVDVGMGEEPTGAINNKTWHQSQLENKDESILPIKKASLRRFSIALTTSSDSGLELDKELLHVKTDVHYFRKAKLFSSTSSSELLNKFECLNVRMHPEVPGHDNK